jgi:hypothetical protein
MYTSERFPGKFPILFIVQKPIETEMLNDYKDKVLKHHDLTEIRVSAGVTV